MDKIGIITAEFQHGQYAQQYFESIASQDYSNKEVCICDDASKDDSINQILNCLINVQNFTNHPSFGDYSVGFFKNTKIILLKNKENKKQAHARNCCLKYFFSKEPDINYFVNLDFDDQLLPTKLSRCLSIFKEYPDIGIVYNDVILHDSINNTNVYEVREPFSRRRLEQEDIIPSCCMFSKQAILSCNLFNEQMPPCEDYYAWLKISRQFIGVHIPEALHIYNITNSSCTFQVPSQIWQEKWARIRKEISEGKI